MSIDELIWGAVLVGCGVFISVYGNLLYRFVLAVLGFAAWFAGALALTGAQETGLRIVVGLVAGIVGAVLLYSLFRFGLYIAGGVFGVVLAGVVASLLDRSGTVAGILGVILLIAGAGAGGYFGSRLGDLIVVFATSAAGAFLVVYGLVVWFQDEFGGDLDDPSTNLSTGVAPLTFLVIVAISGLAQFNIADLRRRLLR